ncbi:MBOAT family protein [Aestuariicella hydrocarbonica]|uniref:Probable alginate O-acetylase n=1 Tax=Pseudomaricurvus hydrocarbonicus TaxID=1470433 RepID=A0A9E5K0R5_9GAMM|nr:MBOAT family protein [Aestuariicella hydrocarbonica]NHO66542.1 MBOAT family protein [Aestuariicella hydrocarbonica]
MLFNSFEFILVFLPVVLLGYYLLKRTAPEAAPVLWLVAASLFFYSWWRVEYLPLLLYSILGNYSLGLYLGREALRPKWRKLVLAAGIVINLGLLGYYKYANFFIETLNALAGTRWDGLTILLPLAISFFTFQQIAYLVDSYQGKTRHYGFLHYCLFVSFFPQLIAGPIVHHRDMMPQFMRNRRQPLQLDNISIGLVIFTVGLAKKVLIADNLALFATPVFAKADAGGTLTLVEAWQGALAYSLQLYFDFSGYCDMAVGAARCFGIVLPINFNSPYRSRNIIEFWRRWHITLSTFLRDYLYIALGGNRLGPVRRYANLMLTMLLGGLWHGAGWNFAIWGGLHGIFLVINHGWRGLTSGIPAMPAWIHRIGGLLGMLLTLVCVVFAWVFFRAESLAGAVAMLEGMVGRNGTTLPAKYLSRWSEFGPWLSQKGVNFQDLETLQSLSPLWNMLALWVFVCSAPNIYNLLAHKQPVLEEVQRSRFALPLTPLTGFFCGLLLVAGLLSLSRVSEFLYFQF